MSGLSARAGSTMQSMPKPSEGTDMDITPIKNQRGYRRVLKEIEGLMTAKRGTKKGDRLDVLVALVEAWEAKQHPFDLLDLVI
jgi:HTH-type transcriptional regulator/antitoxin HigA